MAAFTHRRWLSRGKLLTRIHELQHKLIAFFEEMKQSNFCDFPSEFWIVNLQYLTDTFHQISILNTSMQGKAENILMSTYKMKDFQRKLTIWKQKAVEGNLEMFPLLRLS